MILGDFGTLLSKALCHEQIWSHRINEVSDVLSGVSLLSIKLLKFGAIIQQDTL